MPSAHLHLKEEDVVKLVLEFLTNRELNITQLSLERESGVINGVFSDDMLFLRQLILDGQWEDVLEFIQPLEGLEGFDVRQFRFIVLKHSYIELLCIKSEVSAVTVADTAVDEVVKCLNELEKCCPSREEYSSLCLLLTLPRLADHAEFHNWNPSSARVDCFRAIYPLVEKYLPATRKMSSSSNEKSKRSAISTAKNDRLMQLIIKGILYEYCVEYCQHKATSTNDAEVQFGGVLDGTGFTDADLSLPSWLQSIPSDVFACPFEQRSLAVDVEKMDKPSLEASWTEHMLVTPIKPKTFPHSAMPNIRPRSAADIMSRSLNPHLDGLAFGLSSQRHLMALSVGDVNSMSKSYASFHLTGKKSMNTSVDRLFEGGDVFSSSYGDIPGLTSNQNSPPVPPPRRPRSKSPERKTEKSEVPNISSDAGQKPFQNMKSKIVENAAHETSAEPFSPKKEVSSSPELYKEFQKQKLRLQESMINSDNRFREAYDEQHSAKDLLNRSLYSSSPSTLIDAETRKLVPTSTPVKHLSGMSGSKLAPSAQSFSIMQANRSDVIPEEGVLDKTPVRQPQSFGYGSGSPIASVTIRPSGVSVSPNLNRCGDGSMSTNCYRNCSQNSQIPDCSLPSVNSYGVNTFQKTDVQEKAKLELTASPSKTYAVNTANGSMESNSSQNKPRFVEVTCVDDVQAIRAAEFHPNGKLYVIGSNSKTLRICAYPKMSDLRENHQSYQATVLFKRNKHHKGSIYCASWNASGDLLATGSNDKSVKLMRFNAETCNIEGEDIDLTMHDGTVRDLCFMEDLSNKSSLLISGGAGDCKIYVTDCMTGTPFQALSGHNGHILALYTWGGAVFVSGSQDRTIRLWDLRTRGCVNVIPSPPSAGAVRGSPVATVAVDPSGRMLVSGQEDATSMLYDIRGNRIIQVFKPHAADVRTVRFSPRAYYLLTGSYDNKIVLSDLQGDLTMSLPSVVVAEHKDKVIQCRWHPTEFSFLSTSADKTATLWGLPTS